MERGTQGDGINPWGVRLFQILEGVQPSTPAEQSAYDKWLDQTSTREEARRDRIHGAEGVIPTPLWIVLFVISGVIFVYMLFFADSGERAKTQALLMGSVTAVISIMLLLLVFLDSPFRSGVGALATGGHGADAADRRPGARGAGRERPRPRFRVARPGGRSEPGGDAHVDGSRSPRPRCSRSRPSPLRGAGIRRAAGTESRRRRAPVQTRPGSSRRARRGSPTRRSRSTSPRSSPGPTHTRTGTRDSPTSTSTGSERSSSPRSRPGSPRSL